MSRVLVTGASGFLGRGALPALVERGLEVHGVASAEAPARGFPPQVRWHTADLLAEGAGAALVRAVQPTHLLHLAWYAVPKLYWTAPENELWVDASARLLEAFAGHGGRRAVLAGTCAEYDWSGEQACTEDVTPTNPRSPYSSAKHRLARLAGDIGARTGVSVGWGRIFFLHGPGEHPDRLVASVVRGLLAGERVAVSHGRQVRDFLHTADAGAAFAAVLLSDLTGAVNVGSGEGVALERIVRHLGEATGRPDLIGLGERPAPAGEAAVIVADPRRMREAVGWRPALTLEEGLDRTLAWWRDEATGG